jgi:DNA-binding NarL/FixJ family response regulator
LDAIRLLIADDDLAVIDGLVKVLSLEPGVDIVGVAHDAQEAIRLAVQYKPDVVLCDINMPGGGGPIACAGIRDSVPATRVVAHSMYDDRGAMMQMVRAGAIGYILKASPREQMISALDRARRGEAILSGKVASLVVNELSSHLREQERDAERKRRDLASVRQLATGEGLELRLEPIVDLILDKLAGVEVLASVASEAPVDGDAFESTLSIAAGVGFGAELELAVARICLGHAHRLPPGAWTGIKVSPATVLNPAFAESIAGNGERLVCLELGNHPVPDYAALGRALGEIRGPNVLLAVDGVGSSASALRHVVELHPELIKLDPWLIANDASASARLALVEGMARFATGVNAQLVACGVNDKSQLEALRDLGVRFAQGQHAEALVGSLSTPSGDGGDPRLQVPG